jgi:outer membrane protein insertion porin family
LLRRTGGGIRAYVFRARSWVKIPTVKRILLTCLLASASLLPAQTRQPAKPASPSKLISIRVTGSARYTPAQIVAATGLKLGQTVSDEDFKGLSQHLGETGAFSNVAYSFQFNPEGIKLDLQVSDSDPFVPVRFENFVWLSDQELRQKLSAREPLFQGQLPVTGNLADQVSEALQALAIELNLHGRVDYLRAGPQDGPMEAFEFNITGQPITVRQIGFSGAGPAELPLLEDAARRLIAQDYSRSRLALQAENNFLPVFLEHGYLKATVAGPQPKVAEETPEETLVDVTFPVTPGRQYKVSAIQLSGYSNVFPVEKLRELIHLQPVQTANALQTGQDAEALKKLYGTRGYMGVQVRPAPEMNDVDSTVKYVFQFEEGSIYKMGDLEVRGLDSKATERIGVDWRLLPGQTYDSAYPRQFLDSIIDRFPTDQWKITVHETPDDQDKVVDVSLHFEPIR